MRTLVRCSRCYGDGRNWGVPCEDCNGTGRVEDRAATDELVFAAGEKFGTRLAEAFLEFMDDHRDLVDAWQSELGWVVQSRFGMVVTSAEDPRLSNPRPGSVRCVDLNNEDHPDAVRLWIKR